MRRRGKPSKGHTWGDFNNDGNLDLFVVNGTMGVKPKDTHNAMYLGDGRGGFVAVQDSEIVASPSISAGTAWSDYDRDGDLDIFVANWGNNTEQNIFYQNNLYQTNWIEIALTGTRSNRFGIGSKVAIGYTENGRKKTAVRWLLPQTGYGSQNEPIVHFGLGSSRQLDRIEVHWSSGAVDRYSDVNSNQLIGLVEGASQTVGSAK